MARVNGPPGPGGSATGSRDGPASGRATWRRWIRRVRWWAILLSAAITARLLLPPGRALAHGCRPSIAGDALYTGLVALSVFVLAWAVVGVTAWGALRRWALVTQVAAAAVVAANLATALVCR